MIRRLVLGLAIVFTTVAPTAASAQDTGDIEITQAELVHEFFASEFVDVHGLGRCATAGFVTLRTVVRDLDTGGIGTGSASTRCLSPGENIKWIVRTSTVFARPGDRVVVTASATGAIVDDDRKEGNL